MMQNGEWILVQISYVLLGKSHRCYVGLFDDRTARAFIETTMFLTILIIIIIIIILTTRTDHIRHIIIYPYSRISVQT